MDAWAGSGSRRGRSNGGKQSLKLYYWSERKRFGQTEGQTCMQMQSPNVLKAGSRPVASVAVDVGVGVGDDVCATNL